MIVRTAKSAGFCFGVSRAVNSVYDELAAGRSVYTFGPITHNETVVDTLTQKGVGVINSVEEAGKLHDATIIIRSHGVDKETFEGLKALSESNGIRLVDSTCAFVKKIHKIVEEESSKGRYIVILGDKDHPEVRGICGWCSGKYSVIADEQDALNFRNCEVSDVTLVEQTTFNYKKFRKIIEILTEMRYSLNVVNTICNATELRQRETFELASQSDAMIVIGGRNSSNTRKLYDISAQECNNTYYIQTLADLDFDKLKSFRCVGITAGASTPQTIIKEVQIAMEENFEQMLEDSFKTIHNGEVVDGTVISVKEDQIILNIGYKADGVITRSEYTNDPSLDLTTVVKEGDIIQVKVIKVNDGEGQVQLSYRKLAAERGSKILEEAFENKTVLKAKVVQILGGGICTVVDDMRVFIPASLVSDVYEKDLEKYKDQEIEFVITEFNPKRRRIIGDRKQLIVAQKEEAIQELFSRIKVGDVIEGTVKNVTDFGAFVDLGGTDGLLHISEMSWGRIENPKKVFKPGDVVKAFIKDIQGHKVALSMKFADQNPWIDAETKYAVGNIVKGKVARMTEFGAFIELNPGVDALLHVSQISRDHIDKPSDVLKLGQEVEAKIVDFNFEEKKISLSIKALLAPEKKETEENAEAAETAAAAEPKAEEAPAKAEAPAEEA
ncbi:MAG: bifunctional 4-hydroxy-3-methylbut-2-enyl diphosphate reductase/30S ribosomal protein S1 [Lachnospiraceae bacterium]|nr:bifunctional 4-hydroxy-3-methylbut-2-enyl diphosphate reductase/30S ribosomal protein S1 [Lachnospiraceae bacterium]